VAASERIACRHHRLGRPTTPPFPDVLARLLNVLNNVTAAEMINRLLWLDESWAGPR
jgi:hypothetical protein